MDTPPDHSADAPRRRPTALAALPLTAACAVIMSIAAACSDEHTDRVADIDDNESVPTMTTRNVATFISDSGYTRYHITTPIWYVFDEARVPRWTFPDGLFLEKYDDLFRQEATLRCDSAVYFSQKKLWRLDGNVRMRNVAGDRFLTQQLFWDQGTRTVYSDSFIHIERSDRVIEGYGFNSNENMTRYTVRRPSGIFPVNPDDTPGGGADNTSHAEPRAQATQTTGGKTAAAKTPAASDDSGVPPSFRP